MVPPAPGFLQGLRRITQEHRALLIFDEVITGFRLEAGGAQARFGITPDLTTLGKIIGGGLPVGAYGGRQEIMELVAPCFWARFSYPFSCHDYYCYYHYADLERPFGKHKSKVHQQWFRLLATMQRAACHQL